jgi:hypothetical protein
MHKALFRFGIARLVFAAMVMLSGAHPAMADPGPPPPVTGPAPDKSDDTLLNPTQAAAMRGFSTDRPTKSTLPYTVDAGHVQIETDLAVYAVGTQAGARLRGWTLFDPTIKLGLTSTIDLEVQATPHEAVISRTGSSRSATTGWGDTYARVKVNLIGDDGGALAIAVAPSIKLPTAPAALGNRAVEGGVIVPVSVSLPKGFTLVSSPEIDVLRNTRSARYHESANFLLNLSHPVGKRWTVYAELFTTRSFEHAVAPVYTVDTAVSFAISPRLQWDMGANFKIAGTVPGAQVYTGLSRRF